MRRNEQLLEQDASHSPHPDERGRLSLMSAEEGSGGGGAAVPAAEPASGKNRSLKPDPECRLRRTRPMAADADESVSHSTESPHSHQKPGTARGSLLKQFVLSTAKDIKVGTRSRRCFFNCTITNLVL